MVRIHPDPPTHRAELERIEACVLSILADRKAKGAVAQLGERLLCKQEVIGSIPFSSTNTRSRTSSSSMYSAEARGKRESFASGLCDRSDSSCVGVRLFFNKLEEVKRTRCFSASCDGLDCIDPFSLEFGEDGYRKHP